MLIVYVDHTALLMVLAKLQMQVQCLEKVKQTTTTFLFKSSVTQQLYEAESTIGERNTDLPICQRPTSASVLML